MTETRCACGRPSDDAFVCRFCGDDLHAALCKVPDLLEELDIVLSRQTRYTTGSGGGHSVVRPLMFNPAASDARDELGNAITTACRLMLDAYGRFDNWTDSLTDAAFALDGSLDSIRLQPFGQDVLEEITSAVEHVEQTIDRPMLRQYLGDCGAEVVLDDGTVCPPCPGRLLTKGDEAFARCDTCGSTRIAETLRAELLEQLDDKICSAAEIATLSTYLGLSRDREQVRKLVNQWASRGRLEHTKMKDGEQGFKFGKVYQLLVIDDAQLAQGKIVVNAR